MSGIDPVRACCGQRHTGIACPDGLVMCCLCFERVPKSDLSATEEGFLADVCQTCRDRELEEIARRQTMPADPKPRAL